MYFYNLCPGHLSLSESFDSEMRKQRMAFSTCYCFLMGKIVNALERQVGKEGPLFPILLLSLQPFPGDKCNNNQIPQARQTSNHSIG